MGECFGYSRMFLRGKVLFVRSLLTGRSTHVMTSHSMERGANVEMPMGQNNSKLFRVHVTLKRSIFGGFLQGQILSQVFDRSEDCHHGDWVTSSLVPLTLTHPYLSKVCGTGCWHLLSRNSANQRGRYPKYQTRLCYGALLSGRQQENVPDGCWEGEAGFWHGHSSLKVIHTNTQVRAAEGLQGLKSVLQKAQQVPGIYPVPRNRSPGGNWMLPTTETGALEGHDVTQDHPGCGGKGGSGIRV